MPVRKRQLCMAADLRISFDLHDDADGMERITLPIRTGRDVTALVAGPPARARPVDSVPDAQQRNSSGRAWP